MIGNSENGVSPPRISRKARYGADKFILVNRYRIHYVESGQGEPLVLVPGLYRMYHTWNILMPLMDKEYRFILLDYVEVADSGRPGPGFDDDVRGQTDLLVRMLVQMGLSKVTLVGDFYGSAIVFDMAARYPEFVKKIICFEGGAVRPKRAKGGLVQYRLKFPVPGGLYLQITHTGGEDRPPAKLTCGKWYTEMSPEYRREGPEAGSSRNGKESWITGYKISFGRKTSGSIEESARSLKMPILYLYGTLADRKEILVEKNIQYFKNYLPQAWVVALEGEIYDLAMHRPEEVAGLILEFLRKKPLPFKK